MVTAFAILLGVHGLIHLLGAAKGLGWAELPQLTLPISPAFGGLWLVSALLFFATVVSLFLWPRGWWVVGACAVGVSMVVIVPSWTDAKFGAMANGIVLLGLAFGFLSQGPFSLRAEYERDVERHVTAPESPAPATEADLAHLPPPVQRYLRVAGVLGQPRVRTFRVRMHGRIRNGPAGRWMPFRAEQYNAVDPPARLFYMNASMVAVPVQGYHRYVGSSASMRVKAAALVPVAAAEGPEMTQSETVTFFNDMCVLAPATLVDPAIEWQAIDDRRAAARFSLAGHTIRAELVFNERGELTDFVSDDRYQATADGTSPERVRWSTPIGGYRSYGAVRLASGGNGRWHERDGDYAYIELTFDDFRYNVSR